MANGLLELGIHKGDRVALFLPNIPEFVIGYFAIQKIGAIAVSVNAMLKSEEVKYIINDAEARVILTTALLRQEIPADALPSIEHIIVSEGDAGNDLSFDHLLSRCSGQCRCLDLDIHDPAAILYTSGTTGFPKGAVLTQYNIVSNSRSASKSFRSQTRRLSPALFAVVSLFWTKLHFKRRYLQVCHHCIASPV